MVQVDVFWSYGIGAGFALAAANQLRRPASHLARSASHPLRSGRPAAQPDPATDPYLLATVLYAAVLFAPSGAWLLWGFTSWETMHAGSYNTVPAWLVALFAATNTTQAALGYLVTRALLRRGRLRLAYLQLVAAYFGMFFILVHGWDGRGYQRFFSASREVFATWPASPTVAEASSRAGDWLTSPVAVTLYLMGVALIPAMIAPMVRWIRAGHRTMGTHRSAALLVGLVFAAILGLALGAAIVASVLIHQLGWWIGVPVAAGVLWLLVLHKRIGLAHAVYRPLALA